ncbi:hypothetical protein EI94DRAFT_1825550 [Lactarius quietus]|nr:hypothetical protein EI94DRAFT_1825550 [Lactarius quietus]
MTRGIKDTIGSIVESLQSGEAKADVAGTDLLNRLGDKAFGPTAESVTKNAPVIAPDATITPDTQGRRSLRSDGHDPFHSDAPGSAPAPASVKASAPATASAKASAPAPATAPATATTTAPATAPATATTTAPAKKS